MQVYILIVQNDVSIPTFKVLATSDASSSSLAGNSQIDQLLNAEDLNSEANLSLASRGQVKPGRRATKVVSGEEPKVRVPRWRRPRSQRKPNVPLAAPPLRPAVKVRVL